MKSQNKDKLYILYSNVPLETTESFTYLGLEVPSIIDWINVLPNAYKVGKRPYYTFENIGNDNDIKCWVLKKYLIETLVTSKLLYGMEVWGHNIPEPAWKVFSYNVSPNQETNTIHLLLLKMGSFPIEIMAME